jgi:hypothetical protein
LTKETDALTDQEQAEQALSNALAVLEEMLDFHDPEEETIVMLKYNYEEGDFEIGSTAGSAEEVYNMLTYALNMVKEDMVKENSSPIIGNKAFN